MFKKKKFKYQQGGAARAFNVPIQGSNIQPFAPIIQIASQPIETGFNAQQFIEQTKLRKLQEQRLAEQAEFEKIRFAAELEQQGIVNEQARLKSTQLITDPILNINSIAGDQPRLERLKEKYGVSMLPAGDPESVKTFRENVSKMVRDPEYANLRKRHLAYTQYNDMITKGQFKDANQDGYIDEQPLNDFLDGKTDDLFPKVKVGYETFKEDKIALQKLKAEEDRLSISERQRKLDESKRLTELRKPYEDKKFKLIEDYFKETDPTKQEEIYRQIEKVDGMLNGKFDSQKTTSVSIADQVKELQATAKLQKMQEHYKKYGVWPTDDDMEASSIASTIGDKYSSPENWSNWFDHPKTTLTQKKSEIDNLNNVHNGKYNSLHINVAPPKGKGDKEYSTTEGNTGFAPSSSAYTEDRGQGTMLFIDGTVYRKIKKDEKEDYLDRGWVENTTVPYLGGKKISVDSDHTVVSASGSMPLSMSKSQTTQTGLPSVESIGTRDVKTEFNTIGLKISNPAEWDIFAKTAPSKMIDASIELKSILGDKLVNLSGYPGDKSKHHNGEYGDYNFDIGDASNPGLHSTFLTNGSLNPAVVEWAKKHNYAIVYEQNKGPKVDFKKLKPGEFVASGPASDEYTAPHLHFEYIPPQSMVNKYLKK